METLRQDALEGSLDFNQCSVEDQVTMFWHKKKVLVTGHTGFKGGWLALWLQELGAQVTGYSLPPPTKPSFFEEALVGKAMNTVISDVRDGARLQEVFREHRPEFVIHMAAQPLVRRSYRDPVETYATNVMGTVSLLEAIRQVPGARVVIIVTSDKCYENREWVWSYRENDRLGGHDPYSNSKGCAELVTAAFRSSFFHPSRYEEHGVAVASVRAGNVIGGGDWAEDRLLPDIMRAFTARQPALVRKPGAIRPWQHVLEPLSGYLQLAQRLWEAGPEYAEAWNFGPADVDPRPVSWVVEWISRRWGEGASWRVDDAQYAHEAQVLRLDSSKAIARLEWRPRWGLERALEATVEWYKAHQAGKDMREFSLRQIQQHEMKASAASPVRA